MYNFTGTIITIRPTQTFKSGFTKREVIVEKGEKYKKPIKVSFIKDNCALLDRFMPGDSVSVKFEIDGREWDGPKGKQYFVDIIGLGIEGVGADSRTGGIPSVPPPPQDICSTTTAMAEADDIPF